MKQKLKSLCIKLLVSHNNDKNDSFVGQQKFVVGYSKAPEQPQSSARLICHSRPMTNMGREPAAIRITAKELAALLTAPPHTAIGMIYQIIFKLLMSL